MYKFILSVFVIFFTTSFLVHADPVKIVSAENFYGDIAKQMGGTDVTVMSVLRNPEQDPHLFEAGPLVARELTDARIVICSGIGYDPWMTKLLASTHVASRKIIVVADLIGAKNGDNPHIWYDPETMLALAKALDVTLTIVDPPNANAYHLRLKQFQASLAPLMMRIASLRARFARTPATATEPIFGYMFRALGMEVRNPQFQLAVMNGTEPGAKDIGAFETDLRRRRVDLLVYNSQATDSLAQHMVVIAKADHIPVVGATETEPPGITYQRWMMDELDAVEKALSQDKQ